MKQLIKCLPPLGIAIIIVSGCATRRRPEVASVPEPAPVPASSASASAGTTTAAASTSATPAPKSDFEQLQGSWIGKQVGGDSDATASLVISGHDFEVRGANPDEWYKGTITLRDGTNPRQCVFAVKDCASPDYVGKNANAIYRFDNGTLLIAGNEPGNPEVPSGFDAPTARRFEFRLK